MNTPVAAAELGEAAAGASAAAGGPRHRHSPRVRRMALDQGVALDTLTGTGPHGRVTPADVLAAESHLREQMSRPPVVVAERPVSLPQPVTQLTTVVEVDMTRVAALRERIKDDVERRAGGRLTLTTFFVHAAATALRLHPLLNASISPDGRAVIRHPRQHLGVTLSTPDGLLTPVIRDAGGLSLFGLARKLTEAAERTRSGQIGPDELTGATFTLTSTGSLGVLVDTPIVNPPQVGTLGTGVLVERPVVVRTDHGPAIAIRSMAYLALSYDPRLLDSSDTARFLATVKTSLESAHFASYPSRADSNQAGPRPGAGPWCRADSNQAGPTPGAGPW